MGTMIVLTGWQGSTYGLRISKKDRDALLRGLDKITLKLPLNDGRAQSMELSLNNSFWRSCPEFRSRDIGTWMKKRGDCPWRSRQTPKYRARVTGSVIEIVDVEQVQPRVKKYKRYPPEIRERAARLVPEHRDARHTR